MLTLNARPPARCKTRMFTLLGVIFITMLILAINWLQLCSIKWHQRVAQLNGDTTHIEFGWIVFQHAHQHTQPVFTNTFFLFSGERFDVFESAVTKNVKCPTYGISGNMTTYLKHNMWTFPSFKRHRPFLWYVCNTGIE